MAIRSRQIGWSNKSNLLYDILREVNALKGQFAGPTTTTTTTIDPNNLTLSVSNSTNFDIPLGGFYTIEWFGKITSDDNHPRPWSIGSWPSAAHAVSIENGNFYYWINGSIVINVNISSYNYIGYWTHFCIMRSGADVYIFINGEQIFVEVGYINAIPTNGYDLFLGSEGNDSVMNGLMSNFRWTNDAVYDTSGFTPPTAQLHNVAGTVLNIFQGESLISELHDNSGNSYTITNTTGVYNQANPFTTDIGSIGFGQLYDATFKFTGYLIDTGYLDVANAIGDSFAVKMYWGDGSCQIYYNPGESYYNTTHIYASSGAYDVVIEFLTSPTYPLITNKVFDFYCQSLQYNSGKFDSINFNKIVINNCSFTNDNLTSTVVNSVLNQILTNSPGPVNPGLSYIDLSGQIPPAPPTGQGLTDKADLISAGWVVTTD